MALAHQWRATIFSRISTVRARNLHLVGRPRPAPSAGVSGTALQCAARAAMPKAHSRAFALRVSGSTPEHVNQVCCRSSLLRPCARHAPPCTPRARTRRTARREPCDSEERHGRGPRGRVLRRVRCPDSERATLLRTTNRVIRVWSCDDGVVGRRAIWAQRGAGRARAGRELGRREPGGAVRCERTGAGPGEAGGGAEPRADEAEPGRDGARPECTDRTG